MKTALVDVNNIVQNVIVLEDQNNLPPIPLAPEELEIPNIAEPALPENADDLAINDYKQSVEDFKEVKETYAAQISKYNDDYKIYHLNLQSANKSRYTPADGLVVQQINDWVNIGDSADMPEPIPPKKQGGN